MAEAGSGGLQLDQADSAAAAAAAAAIDDETLLKRQLRRRIAVPPVHSANVAAARAASAARRTHAAAMSRVQQLFLALPSNTTPTSTPTATATVTAKAKAKARRAAGETMAVAALASGQRTRRVDGSGISSGGGARRQALDAFAALCAHANTAIVDLPDPAAGASPPLVPLPIPALSSPASSSVRTPLSPSMMSPKVRVFLFLVLLEIESQSMLQACSRHPVVFISFAQSKDICHLSYIFARSKAKP